MRPKSSGKLLKVPAQRDDSFADRDLYSGLIRLHVLHHAAQGPVFGLGISPGTLYPLLYGLEHK
jgi:hypothetical protein